MSIVFYQERRANSSESHTDRHKELVQGALIHGDNIKIPKEMFPWLCHLRSVIFMV